MRLLLIGAPGSGKGTQAVRIAERLGITHISSGDLLRQHVKDGTAIGRQVQEYVSQGDLVPDQIVLDMVRAAFIEAKAHGGGYVLDGMPRNMAQARALYEIGLSLEMTANVALHLKADDEELTRRLLARAALEGRSDDTEEVIRRRLAIYHEVTYPIVEWYASRGILVSVDAVRPVERVARQILTALEAMRSMVEHVPEHVRRPVDLTGLGAAFGRN